MTKLHFIAKEAIPQPVERHRFDEIELLRGRYNAGAGAGASVTMRLTFSTMSCSLNGLIR